MGYDGAAAAGWYQDKLKGVSLEDYPVLYWLREALDSGKAVLEVGGHVGVACYGFSTVLTYPPGLSWTIWDVPSIVAAGQALARERGRTDLHFVSDPRACPGADIVLAAGALQYLEEPSLAELVASLPRRPRHVLVNLTPVHDGPAFVTLQDIGAAVCPYRIFNRAELVGSLDRLGYALVDTWFKPRELVIPGRPELSFDRYSGFYFRER